MITVRERVLTLRILEKQEKYPKYAEKIGVQVKVKKKAEYLKGEEDRCLR